MSALENQDDAADWREAQAEIARLRAELAAVRSDAERWQFAEAEAMALVLNHEARIERQAWAVDELLRALGALIERCAFDGVPNDSLPVWNEARGVHARVIADAARGGQQ